MPRCSADRPPTPLVARSTTCAVTAAAATKQEGQQHSDGPAGP